MNGVKQVKFRAGDARWGRNDSIEGRREGRVFFCFFFVFPSVRIWKILPVDGVML